MKSAIKSSIEWNNINRIFYMGLYKDLSNPQYLKTYYKLLHMAIMQRGKYCPHYKHGQ